MSTQSAIDVQPSVQERRDANMRLATAGLILTIAGMAIAAFAPGSEKLFPQLDIPSVYHILGYIAGTLITVPGCVMQSIAYRRGSGLAGS
jgi:hypothetical protein